MLNSPLLTLHRERGARLASTPTGDALLTYGDVPAEYEAATKAALLFDETSRGLIAVRGSDAKDFLHRLLANRVKGLDESEGNANMLLTGKGKIAEMFDLTQDGQGGYLLSTEPGRAAGLIVALDMFLFVDDVQLEDLSEEHSPISIVGPGAAKILAACLSTDGEGEQPAADDSPLHHPIPASFQGQPARQIPIAVAGCRGFRIEVAPSSVAGLWDALLAAGAKTGGLAIHDILRVEACAGLFGKDIDDSIYPQEARLEESFNLDKGCYIGQEVVAKIDTYGGLNKRLMLLSMDHDNPVPSGTRLERYDEKRSAWRDLGIVTSWAYSFAIDGGCVLAYVKRRNQDLGTEFRLGEKPEGDDNRATARIVDLPRE